MTTISNDAKKGLEDWLDCINESVDYAKKDVDDGNIRGLRQAVGDITRAMDEFTILLNAIRDAEEADDDDD